MTRSILYLKSCFSSILRGITYVQFANDSPGWHQRSPEAPRFESCDPGPSAESRRQAGQQARRAAEVICAPSSLKLPREGLVVEQRRCFCRGFILRRSREPTGTWDDIAATSGSTHFQSHFQIDAGGMVNDKSTPPTAVIGFVAHRPALWNSPAKRRPVSSFL
jgi:hypothetical protein